MLKGNIQFAHHLIDEVVTNEDVVIDATCGNGHDTVFLSNKVGPDGKVFAFDIQKEALIKTKERALKNNLNNIEYFHASHEKVDQYISSKYVGKVKAAIFNLGYLPGGDKSIVTKPESTINAISKIISYLDVGGIIVLVVYHGHEEGKKEKNHLLTFVKELDQTYYSVLQYQFINQRNNPPFVLAIEKRKD